MGRAIQPEIFKNHNAVVISCGKDAPAWLPREMRDLDRDIKFKVKITKSEKRIFRKKNTKQKPSEWAEKNRVITVGPLAGHKMNFDVTNYLRGILDASIHPSVREISVCAAPQVGKSAIVDTFLGYVAVHDPGPALVVYPDKETAKENCKDRIQPMIDKSPELRDLKTGYSADETGIKIKLQSMSIHMGWSGSAASLGNKSIRYAVEDEKDKSQITPNKKEAAGTDLVDKRMNTYPHNNKKWNVSTPTIEAGPIWQDITQHANVLFQYKVKCPDCGNYQQMMFGGPDTVGGIKWPKEQRDPAVILSDFSAWYQCEHCDSKWDDVKRDRAVLAGNWFSPDARGLFAYLKAFNPRHIAFHIPAWLSHFISLSKCVASFLKGVVNKLKLRDHQNNIAAEPWLEYQKDVDKEITRLKTLIQEERPEGRVPGGGVVAELVCGVDTQDNGFFYKICGVGYGLTQEYWLIKKGFVDSFEALAEVLWEHEYLDAEGNKYPVVFTVMDAMGHRTADVYDFCRANPGRILPSKGERTKSQAYTYGNLEYYPGTKKIIPGGLKLVNVNTKYFKDLLDAKLNVAPTDPGAFHLHAGMDEDYFRQMTAEYIDDNGFWQQIGSRPNHYWDCSANCMVAADIRNIKHWPTPEQASAMAQDNDDSSSANNNDSGQNNDNGRW